jgi:hypothetical protein
VRFFENSVKRIAKYKLDFVGVQEVRWNKGSTEPADNFIFCMEVGMLIIIYLQSFVHNGIM